MHFWGQTRPEIWHAKIHSMYPLEGFTGRIWNITKVRLISWGTVSPVTFTVFSPSMLKFTAIPPNADKRRRIFSNVDIHGWTFFTVSPGICPGWANWTNLSSGFHQSLLEMLEWMQECHRQSPLPPPPKAVEWEVQNLPSSPSHSSPPASGSRNPSRLEGSSRTTHQSRQMLDGVQPTESHGYSAYWNQYDFQCIINLTLCTNSSILACIRYVMSNLTSTSL